MENFRNFLHEEVIFVRAGDFFMDAFQFETVPPWVDAAFVPRGTFPISGLVPKMFHVEQKMTHATSLLNFLPA